METISKKKSLAMRKRKTIQSAEDFDKGKNLKSIANFQLSIDLINLLRNPTIKDHEFDESYL